MLTPKYSIVLVAMFGVSTIVAHIMNYNHLKRLEEKADKYYKYMGVDVNN